MITHTEAALKSNKRNFWIQYSDFSDAKANVPVDLYIFLQIYKRSLKGVRKCIRGS
jgi:hypothetical protein